MRAAVLAAALALAACTPPTPPPPPEPLPTIPGPAIRADVSAAIPSMPPSEESQAARLFYTGLERRLLAQGLMRRDEGSADAAYGPFELARNFETIALFSELTQRDGRFVADGRPGRLNRWRDPVRIQMHFGPSVGPEERREERARVAAYADRLGRASNHPISLANAGGNFHVFLVSLDEQRALAPAIRAVAPGLGRAGAAALASLDRSTYCTVFALAGAGDPHVLTTAVALVRTEHPDLSRLACYHEEIAQGLGLTNDSDLARPSIFNDDDEFALLTRHDEQLLRILYDPRLSPGMSPEEARPIVRALAAQLVGESPT
jgi:hypothetical protein